MKYMYINKLKSIKSTLSGSISSIIPLFFACCKSGACVGVCASPVASFLGISSASFTASPIFNAVVPLLIALSAISFTISYYNLYVLPKFNRCNTECDCETPLNKRKEKVSKWIFWIGLIASIFFFVYFGIQNWHANTSKSEQQIIKAHQSKSEPLLTDSLNISDATIDKPCCSDGQTCE